MDTTHPSRVRLAEFGLGRLTAEESLDIERHLDVCESCQAGVDTVPDDDLVRLVKESAPALDSQGESRAATRTEYSDLQFFAKGGLGVVSIARDQAFGRSVAIKRLLPNCSADPERRKRFLREAMVTARMEHPGIVPVYGVGEDESGQLCYAMRFVPGNTLLDAIRVLHRTPPKSDDLRPLLGRFLSLCSTVAYAHSRGVVHRDIKPSNVAIGSFGETILLDWGIAQLETDSANAEVPSSANTPEPFSRFETATGTVLGTPGFIAPEQASGRKVGPEADVYSLGATLLALIGESESHSPRTLLAVARKAMAISPKDRYSSALDLAADVECWLADRPPSGVRDPLAVRARRWARRHRLLVATSLAALFVAAVGLGIAAAFMADKNDELRIAVQIARDNESSANKNALKARVATDLSLARQRESEASFKTAWDTVDRFMSKISDDPRLQGHDLELLRRDLLASADGFYQQLAERGGDDPVFRKSIVRARIKRGRLMEATGDWIGAKKVYEGALAMLGSESEDEKSSRLHHFDESNAYIGLSSVARVQGDASANLDAIRKAKSATEAAIGPEPGTARDRVELADMQAKLAGAIARVQGDSEEANRAYEIAFRMIEAIKKEDVKNQDNWEVYTTALKEFANMKVDAGQSQTAENALLTARNFYGAISAEAKDPSSRLLSNNIEVCLLLGSLYLKLNRFSQSDMAFSASGAYASNHARSHPYILHYQQMHAESLMGRGAVAMAQNEPGKAEPFLRFALQISQTVNKATSTESYRQRLLDSYSMLTVCLAVQKKTGVALEQIRKAGTCLKPVPGDAKAAREIVKAWCAIVASATEEKIKAEAYGCCLKIVKAHAEPATVKDALQMLQLMRSAGLFEDSERHAELCGSDFHRIRELSEYKEFVELTVKK